MVLLLLVTLVIDILISNVVLSDKIQNGAGDLSGRLSCQNKCCDGMVNKCTVTDKLSGKMCFCDNHCLRTGDCCEDYKKWCQKPMRIDCIVTNWSEWSSCSIKCGIGSKHRTRKVIIQPANNGQRCGKLKQTRQCKGSLCPVYKVSAEISRNIIGNYFKYRKFLNPKTKMKTTTHKMTTTEQTTVKPTTSTDPLKQTVLLVPDLGMHDNLHKKYSKEYDIREHMYKSKPQNSKRNDSQCVEFEVNVMFGTCKDFWKLKFPKERVSWSEHSRLLEPKRSFCVTCYPEEKRKGSSFCRGSNPAFLKKVQRWRTVRSDICHGLFTMKKWRSKCICKSSYSFLFI